MSKADDAQSAPLWSAVISETADAIWLLDAQDRIVGWNRGAERLLGYRAEEIVGEPLSRLIPSDLLEGGEERALEGYLRERGAIPDYETRRVRKDGTEVQLSLSRTLIRSGAGAIMASVTVARDLSARKRIERQVIESEQLASVGQVAASIAQEIGAPITALGILVEQLSSDDEVASRHAEQIQTIERLLERVGRLSRQLVDLAKPGQPRIRRIDPSALVRETLSLFAPALQRAGIRLDQECVENVPAVEADPHQLEQVVVNLVLNAQRALVGRRRGRIAVAVRRAEGLPSAGHPRREVAEIRVSDNGPGIESEDLPRIFTPFFSRFGGSGLGLSVARQLVDQHGGSLVVDSASGKGATFIVHIPLSRA